MNSEGMTAGEECNRRTQRELKVACQIVEAYARSIGRNCEIILLADTRVQVAPLSWAGDVTAPTLYEALTEAMECRE